tara:strand:+ start:371 stop:1357 length:987 start_codon:yes stop_codon:yes gene_type:complete
MQSNDSKFYGLSLIIILLTFFLSTNTHVISKQSFVIEKGMSLDSVSTMLFNQKIINNKNLFKVKVMAKGLSSKIPAGTFVVEGRVSDKSLIDTIFKVGPVKIKLVLPEGLNSKQIFTRINNLFDTNINFPDLITENSFVEIHNIQSNSVEGYLYPSTYYFYHNTSPQEVINTLLSEFWKQFDIKLQNRAIELGFTVHEVLTLASIIEGEAMLNDERAIISSVYHNRLKINMKLQADPTIQYIIPGPPKAVSTRDLKIKSPYNTYMNYGLPPGPINNPGLESIKAALYPADTNFLFFVAQGDGSHAFSTNEKDHEKAKRIYKINKRKNR